MTQASETEESESSRETRESESSRETREFVELNRRIEKQLDTAYKVQRRAWDRMYTAVLDAKEAGWSNQDIGYVLGMTEGGIRMMVKRKSGRMYFERGNR